MTPSESATTPLTKSPGGGQGASMLYIGNKSNHAQREATQNPLPASYYMGIYDHYCSNM